jgi:hypothetical protein
LGPTGYGHSPYQSLSSFAGNPLLVSPDWLIEDGLLRASDLAGRPFSAATVDFDAVKRFKSALLETAWGRFRSGARPDLRLAFELFAQAHADWLDDYALFHALKARYGGASHLQWPEDLVRRTPAALEQARRDLASQVEQVTKDPGASDTLYIQALAAPFTVNTMPEGTLKAVADHGSLGGILTADGGDCEEVLARFAAAGIDVDALANQLQDEGAKSFVTSWRELMDVNASKSAALDRAS